ncbi:ImmA/IrrE family metallo-endopeptidase [Spongiibacter taiwanensis]|uniref:ImmA/IrrE family metallo-endopeptidase n=1 Tax=Spongiibacter taiwanensis TaxID=1748242 RepID=UPI002034D47A|nr:ImmA/IrrE family metallo-endopeptidase [Spongiibacter taiwanensis]USA44537.1 ImmA/IrrE family metallo-endopeptidase [Spongiibacter taiwanensis]
MNHIKLIRDDATHQQALARLDYLMEADPQENSAEAEELEVLSVLIEHYEEQHFPIDLPDPIAAIEFRMDQLGLKAKDLIPYIGSASKVSEVLNGTRKLSLNMIRRLNEGLKIPAEVLIREPAQKAAVSAEIDWRSFPLNEMRKRGYFPNFSGTPKELREYAEEWLSSFLDSIPGGRSLRPTLLRSSARLRASKKVTDAYALWAWQVRVMQKASAITLPTEYRKGVVTEKLMVDIAQLSSAENGPALARERLAQHGIYLIVEPHLPKTYMDGAVCTCPEGNPIIALTLRYDRLDNFWFTLLHELAHISLHLDGENGWFIDDLDATSDDQQEVEADKLAESTLIPISKTALHGFSSADEVKGLADTLKISPCIIAGRLRHDFKSHQLFGTQFREQVRYLFAEYG